MKCIRGLSTCVLTLLVAGCAQPMEAQPGIPIAGLYSAGNSIGIAGGDMTTANYLYIAPDGRLTAYTSRSWNTSLPSCFQLAKENAPNAVLQGLTLTRGFSPYHQAAYLVTIFGDETFGVLVSPGPTGREWFVSDAKKNKTVVVSGRQDVLIGEMGNYAITGLPLVWPTLADLKARMCPT